MQRHVDEARVSDVAVAIGEGQPVASRKWCSCCTRVSADSLKFPRMFRASPTVVPPLEEGAIE